MALPTPIWDPEAEAARIVSVLTPLFEALYASQLALRPEPGGVVKNYGFEGEGA